jgi:phage/plasmid-like protein (TIGR03299 family)
VYANDPAWHGLGTVLDTEGELGLEVQVALEQSGLDWEVEKVPVFIAGQDARARVRVPGRWGVRRTTDGAALGVVGNTWQPVQNAEGFAVLSDLLAEAGGEVWIESAGALDEGRKVWILARCAAELQIAGEQYRSYIGFCNGHDGRTAVTAFMTDVRVVCTNTLGYAVGGAERSNQIVRVRHSTRSVERLSEARHILGLRSKRLEELAVMGEWLVEAEMPDGEFELFLEQLMPLDPDTEGTPAHTMIGGRREELTSLYYGSENLGPIRGTRWGALQAVTEYADHRRLQRNINARAKAQFGLTATPIKQWAAELLLAD